VKTGTNDTDLAPPLSREEYCEVFRAYKSISSEWTAMLGWIENHLLKELAARDHYSVLSVGCGGGDFDSELITALKRRCGFIDYVAVEPDLACCEQFKTLIDSRGFDGFRYEVHSSSFERLGETFGSQRSFDLIHFTHSLYYIKHRDQALLSALDMLEEDGRLLIFHQTEQGINQVQQRFLQRVTSGTDFMLSSRDLEAALKRYLIPYRLEIIDSFLDITGISSQASVEAHHLMNFFLESKVSALSADTISEVFDYIQSIAFTDKGRRLIYHPVAILSIFKPKTSSLEPIAKLPVAIEP
jgi:SAM-dependent methyltransferase